MLTRMQILFSSVFHPRVNFQGAGIKSGGAFLNQEKRRPASLSPVTLTGRL
jgi:hypothetical protein